MERKFDKKEYGKQDKTTSERSRNSSGGARGETGKSGFVNRDKSKPFGDKGKTSWGGKSGGDRPDRENAGRGKTDWKKPDRENMGHGKPDWKKPDRENAGHGKPDWKKPSEKKSIRINPDWKKISKESPDGKNVSSFVSKKELRKKLTGK